MTTKITDKNLDTSSVTSAKVVDSEIVNADISASAAIDVSKTSGVPSASSADTLHYSIGLLGFKMAVSNSLSVFGMSDALVDEYHDTSGVSSSTGMTYNSGSDYYNNSGGASGTITSDNFTATAAPSKFRVVLLQENVGSPTANTDFIVKVSRDGGSNYTTVTTLSDAGYVTGASGTKIWTATTDFSSASGSTVKYQVVCANQESRIHGISISWA
jgi:hypothetical protein